MPEFLQSALNLSSYDLAISATVVLLASVVRGFAGFGLSALIMTSLAFIMPPVTLVPVCLMLEGVASLLMIRSGLKQADHRMVWGLAIGSAIGVPFGLFATVTLAPDISRFVALTLILVLAALQWFKQSPAFLATTPGLYLSGFVAGIATGLASVGGMVVALYVLAQNAPAERIRSSVVMYLFLGMFTSIIWFGVSGILDLLAIKRAAALAPLVVLGVITGSYLFNPALQQFYKRFCLVLLMALAMAGLARLALS